MTTTLRISALGFLLIIQTFSTKKVFAQYINFNLGPSFAMGDFASTDFSNEKAGYAGVGINFNGNFMLKHDNSIFTVGAQLFYNQNTFKIGEAETQFNAIYGKDLNKALNYPSGTYYTFSNIKSWDSWGAMVGAYCYTSKTSPLKGFARAMIGRQVSSTYSYSIMAPNFFYKEKSTTANNIIYLIGGGIQFASNELVSFKIGVDYLLSNPKYTSVVNPFSVINATVGLEIRLHKPVISDPKKMFR